VTDKFRVLLVDDMLSARTDVERGLARIGVDVDVDFRCPADPAIPFGCELPSPEGLARFDVALVDLELFPLESEVEYRAADLRGGTEVLPYLREHAPWLPAIAVSRLYRQNAEHLFVVAGSFGFDGHVPRNTFRSKWLTREAWGDLLSRARELRRMAVTGWQGGRRAREHRATSIDVSESVALLLDADVPGWRVLIEKLFPFAERVALEALAGGYSGATLLRAHVDDGRVGGHMEGQWAVKLSCDVAKLHCELRAHLEMVRRGLEFARSVQLLWSGLIVSDGVAGLAYQFAVDAQEASKWFVGRTVEELGARLAALLRSLHRNPSADRGVVRNIAQRWLPRDEVLVHARKMVGSGQGAQLLDAILASTVPDRLGKVVEYHRARLHGDLHLGNVLFGQTDVLIDFARSDVGPMIEDAAKLLVDVCVRSPEVRSAASLSELLRSAPMSTFLDSLGAFYAPRDADTVLLMNVLTVGHLARHLSYPRLDEDTRRWIVELLSAP